MKCSVTLIGQWEMSSGNCKLIYLSRSEKKTTSTSNQLFQKLTDRGKNSKIILPSSIIRGLCNKGIFLGKANEPVQIHSECNGGIATYLKKPLHKKFRRITVPA